MYSRSNIEVNFSVFIVGNFNGVLLICSLAHSMWFVYMWVSAKNPISFPSFNQDSLASRCSSNA